MESLRNFDDGTEEVSLRNFSGKSVSPIQQRLANNQAIAKVENNGDEFIVRIKKSIVREQTLDALAKHLKMLCSGIFTKERGIPSVAHKGNFRASGLNLAFFMDNNAAHYSGGRYLAILWIYILAKKNNITVVTNIMPSFLKDFKEMDSYDTVRWIVSDSFKFPVGKEPRDLDAVVGIPEHAGQYAHAYATTHNLPIYLLINETPNFVRDYRKGLDSTDEYWRHYTTCMRNCDGVIAVSGLSAQYCREHLGEGYSHIPIHVVYNPLNQVVADKINKENIREEHSVAFISRCVAHKNPLPMIRELCKLDNAPAKINIIGMAGGGTQKEFDALQKKYKNTEIIFHKGINDHEKFRVLKSSKVLAFPTEFEGFGMSPMEAFYMGKPVVAYDLPVLKEVYKDTILFTPKGNAKAIAGKVSEVLDMSDGERMALGERGAERVKTWCTYDKCLDSLTKIVSGNASGITAGMIVLNASSFIDYSLKNLYDQVDQIIIVEGAVADYARVNPELVKDGCTSIDDTIMKIRQFPDPENKIELIVPKGQPWENKAHMQNEIAERVKGGIYYKCDADEIIKSDDMKSILNMFSNDTELEMVRCKYYHFWKNFKQYTIGGQWESAPVRFWRWHKGHHHNISDARGFNYFLDKRGNRVSQPDYKEITTEDRVIYHIGFVELGQNAEFIRGKINYYKNRNIENRDMVKDTWSHWEPGKATQPTHGGGVVKEFEGELPAVLKGGINNG